MPAKHGTPLDLLALPSLSNYSIGLVSARGSQSRHRQRRSRLHHLANQRTGRDNTRCEFETCEPREEIPLDQSRQLHPPIGKDGFLATNSLLSFMVLIHRAYAAAAGREITLPSRLPEPLDKRNSVGAFTNDLLPFSTLAGQPPQLWT